MEHPLSMVRDALVMSAGMAWDVGWSLVLGFALSGLIQAVVSQERMRQALRAAGGGAGDRVRRRQLKLLLRLGRGVAHAVQARRRPGALARLPVLSTNLVVELGIILYLLLGWQFTAAEWIGGVVLVAIMAALFLKGASPWVQIPANALIGPLVAVLSFVCSIGNVPLAAVLWASGISFGGVLAFLYADLIVVPLLDVYRRYYGWRMAAYIGAVTDAVLEEVAAWQARPFEAVYPLHLDRADAGLHLAVRPMAVPHQAIASVR